MTKGLNVYKIEKSDLGFDPARVNDPETGVREI
jgi:hypothetical protein